MIDPRVHDYYDHDRNR